MSEQVRDDREPGRRRPAGLGPLGRPCPTCGAEPQRRCTMLDGTASTSAALVHPARRTA